MKTDALKRRSRFAKPQPLDTRLELTDRDYALFEALDRHGKLSTNYLYEFTKHLGKDYSFLQRRLTQLYNGYCDHPEHKNGFEGEFTHVCKPHSYLMRDWQQWNNFQARYQPAVYGLTPLGKKALHAVSRGTFYSPERNDPFLHQFMGACVSASFELQCKERGIRFISREEILTHEKCPKATTLAINPFAIPVTDPEMKAIVPDNVFGMEYPDGGFRFFAVEIDRNTETISPRKPVKNSIAKKVRGYLDVLSRRSYSSHFGIPNLTILFITTNAMHMERMIDYVEEAVDKKQQHKFLFKTFIDFGEVWRIPRETLDVLSPYKTAVGEVDLSTK